ncbi:MAG: hypothetical protein AAF682_08070 [Planctomycetota bacterium]
MWPSAEDPTSTLEAAVYPQRLWIPFLLFSLTNALDLVIGTF